VVTTEGELLVISVSAEHFTAVTLAQLIPPDIAAESLFMPAITAEE
jgi:hypothetical protein